MRFEVTQFNKIATKRVLFCTVVAHDTRGLFFKSSLQLIFPKMNYFQTTLVQI